MLVFIRWIVIYPLDSAIHRLNNWGLVCCHAKHCQQRECTVQFCQHIKLKLRPQRTQQRFAQTQTLRRRMVTTQRQSMQSQPQMPGQSMPLNVGVAAGIGQSRQTLKPQQQLPPNQQSVMPQEPVISGPPPRGVEEAQKIAQAATMQAVGSSVPIGQRVPYPQQGFRQQQLPTTAAPSGPMAPPMIRQQNTALNSQNIEQSVPRGI